MIDFAFIYEQYFKDVYRFVYSMCGNESIAEEVTQETFVKALKNIDSYQGRARMKVWLCEIAKNTLYTYQKKHKRFLAWEEKQEKGGYQVFALEEAIAHKETALKIHAILHKLKEPYKEVFTLRIFGELSFIEISSLFNKTESWARVTFFRAKRMIVKELEEENVQ